MADSQVPRILIVDDEADLCEYLKLLVRNKAGYEVDSALDGQEGLKKVKSQGYNLVISDIDMPGMHGIELLKSVKTYNPDIEVIMLTGKSSLETAVQALQYQAFDYIEKPVESRKLLNAMGNALGKQRLNAELKLLLDRVSRERKDLRAKLEQQTAELNRKERLAVTGAVAATLTEAVLTPVEQMIRQADQLMTQKADGRQVEAVAADIRQSAEKLRNTMRDLLEFSHQTRPHIQAHELRGFLDRLVEHHAGLHKDVRFQVEGDIVGVQFYCDAESMDRAFSAILENACDALEGKGRVDIGVGREAGRLIFQFQDNGPGIPPNHLDKVFLPFFSTKSGKGSGLGLAIAKRILEDHHGDIRVESQSGQGCRFIATLPLPERQ